MELCGHIPLVLRGWLRTGVVLPAILGVTTVVGGDLFVAPWGDDTASGTREAPLASLARAVTASRQSRETEARRILLFGGDYFNVAVTLTPADSGLTIAAVAGEHPVLYGGREISGWTPLASGLWEAPLPPFPTPTGKDSASLTPPDWEIRMLSINGEWRPRSRFPRTGRLQHVSRFEVPWMSSTGGGWKRKPTEAELTTLEYHPGDLPEDLDIRNAEITVFHMWDESCVGIRDHDPEHAILRLDPPAGHPPGAFGVQDYVVWNTRFGMQEPGRWYHDRTANRLVYHPKPGESPAAIRAVAPTRFTILKIQGNPDQPVSDLTLRGLEFSVTTVPLTAGGFAAGRYPAAIAVEHARNCGFESLRVARVGGHGVRSGPDIESCHFADSEVASCGAGGIYLGGRHTTIHNNHVHGIGLAYPSAIGIYRGGTDNRVTHNEVHDCSYSAINYGGLRNLVANNLLYDCMKVLHDGAAIYMFAARECILRGNLARDIVDTGGYGASAYYLDERSRNCRVENNVSLRVPWPIHNHMATNNVIHNNLFLVPGDAKWTFPRSSGYRVDHNILWAEGDIRIENPDAVTTWTNNLFYSGTGRYEQILMSRYSAEGRREGAPAGSVLSHPLLSHPLLSHPLLSRPSPGRYEFLPESPAHWLGIEPLDVSAAGRIP